MENPTNISSIDRQKVAQRAITFRLAASYALFLFVASRYLPPPSWHLSVTVFAIGLLALSNTAAFLFIRRGNVDRGIQISTAALQIGLLSTSIVIRDLGFLVMVATISLTALSITNTASAKVTRQAMLAAATAGLTAYIIDLSSSSASFRLALADIATVQQFGWGLVILLLLGNLSHFFRQFTYLSVRAKLLFSFTILTVIFVAILSLINNRITRNALTDEANQSLFAAASQTRDALNDFINNNLIAIKTEAQLPAIREYLGFNRLLQESDPIALKVSRTLSALKEKDPEFIESYAIIGRNGLVMVDTDLEEIGTYKASRKYFIEAARSQQPYVSAVEISPKTNEGALYFSAPVIDDNGDTLGVIRVRYNARILQKLIERSNDLVGGDSFGVLFDENFIHLAHGTAPESIFRTVAPLDDVTFEQLKQNRRLPDLPSNELFLDLPELESYLAKAIQAPDQIEYFSATDIATGSRINQGVIVGIDNPSWLLAFFQPEDVFLAPVRTLNNINILVSLLIGIVGVLAIIGLAQVLVLPITRLTEAATAIAEGNLDIQAEVVTNDEIGLLTNTFNTMTSQLHSLVTNLESQVAERTRDLENRINQVQAAASIARDSSLETNVKSLLNRASDLLVDRFDFYHASMYLATHHNDYVVYTAGSGQGSEEFIEQDHRYKIDPNTNVGLTALVGEPRLAFDDDPANPISVHPLLPSSRSQMCLPLKVGESILGVIDIHSTDQHAFDLNDLPVFLTTADQLAIAIQKNEVREEAEKTLAELETAYGLFTKESWRRFMQTGKIKHGYMYDHANLLPISADPPQVVKARGENHSIILPSQSPTGEKYTDMAVPMRIRGEVVGVLNLKFKSAQISNDLTEFVEDVSQRLSLILENARLVESAQQSVQIEQMTNTISNKMRESLDIDAVVRNAVKEIGESLGLAEVEIRIGQETALNDQPVQSAENSKEFEV